MAALGELIIFLIYALLTIFVLVALGKLIWPRKENNRKWAFFWLIIALIPLTLFSYSQYINHRTSELEEVGVYHLTQYPNCESCLLELKEDNSYSVSKADKIIENGKWHNESGGDYWITYIGESGQLGNDIYRYNKKEDK